MRCAPHRPHSRLSAHAAALTSITNAHQQALEILLQQKGLQPVHVTLAALQIRQRQRQWRIVTQPHQISADTRLLGKIDQILAPFGLLDRLGLRQQAVKITKIVDQLGSRLHANPRHTRHVVCRIPGKRLHIHNLVGVNAKALKHLGITDAALFHRIKHSDPAADKLHQVLVG